MDMKAWLFLFALTSLCLSSCMVSIKTVYDKQADFKSYKTFCWMDGCEFKISGIAQDSALRENVKRAIVRELGKRGLTQDDNNPDLLVGFNITMQDEKVIIYHHSADAPFYRPFEHDSDVMTYLKGTLVLGLADKKQSKLVWESFAVSFIDFEPQLEQEEVLKGVRLVLKRYPPKP
jgi:hypothetical protein